MKKNKVEVVTRQDATITIPLELARLLAAENSDFDTTASIEDVRSVARVMLRMLINSK